MNRGLSVVDTLKILKNDQLTTEELFKSRVLGWCIEWVRTIFKRRNHMFFCILIVQANDIICSFKHSSSFLMTLWMRRLRAVEVLVGTKW